MAQQPQPSAAALGQAIERVGLAALRMGDPGADGESRPVATA
jgi:hypothetical protein